MTPERAIYPETTFLISNSKKMK